MASRESFRDRALVIRGYDFGEADRVLVLLTRSHGLIRAVAKGVRRAKSRFGSRLQPFVDLDVQLYPGRNLFTVSSADTVGYFGSKIIADFDCYTAACAVLETAEKLAYAAGYEDPFFFESVVEALGSFQQEDPNLVMDRFMLRAMAHAGWEPSLFDCAQCEAPGPHHAFHPAVGGASCVQCRPPGAAEVDPETLHQLWLLQRGYVTTASAAQIAEGHRLVRAHLQWHLERKVNSLSVMER